MPLASIQRVESIEPIEGADRIEKAIVLGWECVVRKGEVKKGDLCIYIEIDSIIPLNFLSGKEEDKDKRHRLKTVKMKKQISQGLILPLYSFYSFPEILEVKEGDDVTETLNVEKYEKQIPAHLAGLIKRDFPSFLTKTDETNIQSSPKLLKELQGKSYDITQKMDGTSATYYRFEDSFGVCSRRLELKDGDNIYWRMARKYRLDEWLPDGYCFQGEICGPNIQGNKLKLDEHKLFIFNVYEIKNKHKINPRSFGLSHEEPISASSDIVPLIERGDNFNYSLEELLEKAKGKYESGIDQEGIVVRSVDQTISFKVLNSEHLLKED